MTVRQLMGLGVLDRVGMPPQPFLGAFLVTEDDGLRLALLHGGTDRSWDDPAPPAPPDRWWAGLDGPDGARWRQAGVDLGVESFPLAGEIPEAPLMSAVRIPLAGGPAARLRSVLPSDAAWLSRFAFDARANLEVLTLLAAQHARNWGAVEEIRAIAHPGLPPHALRYRVRPHRDDLGGPVDLFWSGGTWRRGRAVADVRLSTTLELTQERPWLWGPSEQPPSDVVDLLDIQSGPVIRPWGLTSAFTCFSGDPVGHEGVLLSLLSCPEEHEITEDSLGGELTASLRGIGRRIVRLHHRRYPDGIEELILEEVDGPDGFGSEFIPVEPLHSEARIAALGDDGYTFRFSARDLMELLEIVPETLDHYDGEEPSDGTEE